MRFLHFSLPAASLLFAPSPATAADENAVFFNQLRPVVSALKKCAELSVFEYMKDLTGAALAAEQAVMKCTVERVAIRDKAFELFRSVADERYAKFKADRMEQSMRMFVIGQISEATDSAIVEAQNK